MSYPIQKGDATVTWGCDGLHSATFIQSAGQKNAAQKKTLADSQGNTGAVVFYDGTKQMTIEFARKTDTAEINPGDTITINDIDAIVDDADVKWTKDDFCMMSVTATAYDGIAVSGGE